MVCLKHKKNKKTQHQNKLISFNIQVLQMLYLQNQNHFIWKTQNYNHPLLLAQLYKFGFYKDGIKRLNN